jgi:hypothetical protein
MDGDIRAFSGTLPTVGTTFGNFTSVAPNVSQTTAIPGPSGFTPGQWNLWAAISYANATVTGNVPNVEQCLFQRWHL